MFCVNCGNQLYEGQSMCNVCGAVIADTQQPVQSQIVQPQMEQSQINQMQTNHSQQNTYQQPYQQMPPQQNMYQQPYQQMPPQQNIYQQIPSNPQTTVVYHPRKTEFNVYSFFVGLLFILLAFIPKFTYKEGNTPGYISNKDIFEAKSQLEEKHLFDELVDSCSSYDIFCLKLYSNFFIIVIFVGALLILKSFIASKDLHKVTKFVSILYVAYYGFIVFLAFSALDNDNMWLNTYLDYVCYFKEDHVFRFHSSDPGIGFFISIISSILLLLVRPTRESQDQHIINN